MKSVAEGSPFGPRCSPNWVSSSSKKESATRTSRRELTNAQSGASLVRQQSAYSSLRHEPETLDSAHRENPGTHPLLARRARQDSSAPFRSLSTLDPCSYQEHYRKPETQTFGEYRDTSAVRRRLEASRGKWRDGKRLSEGDITGARCVLAPSMGVVATFLRVHEVELRFGLRVLRFRIPSNRDSVVGVAGRFRRRPFRLARRP